MSARIAPFGTTRDGRAVQRITLGEPGGVQAEILTWGAAVRGLRTPGGVDAVLGLPDLPAYEADTSYLGVMVGPFANRIAGAAFEIDGETFRTEANEGPNTLHSGPSGLSHQVFAIVEADATSAVLRHVAADGEGGFPGPITVEVRLQARGGTLEIAYVAASARPTVINLTHHLYFNLSGRPETTGIGEHRLTVAASRFTPTDAALIPTGALAPVAGSALDFREVRRIGAALAQGGPELQAGGGLDHNLALDRGGPALVLVSPETGARLELVTDQPGVQLYSGQGLKPPFVRWGGLAIEPQGFPDAMHHPAFPSPVLRPGETYRRRTLYRLLDADA